MTVTLNDGSKRQFENGLSLMMVAQQISPGLARAAICAKVDGVLADMSYVPNDDIELTILTFKDDEAKEVFRHTAAHILAHAVVNLYPGAQLATGPAVENGFYYDIDLPAAISVADLIKIEEEMRRIVKEDYAIVRREMTAEEAAKMLKDQPYKLQLLSGIEPGSTVSFYTQGDFTDMCRGPHAPSTGVIKAFKLTQLTGAYFKGDENNKMLTRIYGTAFDKKSELDDYLAMLEEAKLRDHNKIGRELGIFMTDEKVGQGLPLLMPKGAKIMQILQRFVEDEEERRGYLFTKTPYMAKSDLYKVSGHWGHYRDKMFIMGDEDTEQFALRPMTCPFQYTIYNNGLKSYRDLPVRYSETSTLFRKESSGEMHGLIRVRQFTLSDGHIICMPAQVEKEFKGALDLAYFVLDALGLGDDVTFRFSKWDKNDRGKYIGSETDWENTQAVMKSILDHLGVKYKEADGEAAFYGPKLDVQIKNVYGKEDTIITIQVDFALAERFGMTYIDADGTKKHPVIIHRSSIGCYERTLALLIEKYAGALPLWISPVQVRVLSLTDRTAEAALQAVDSLRLAGITAEADLRSEKIGYKIREAQLNKIPYMLVIGDKEMQQDAVSVRRRGEGDLGTMQLAQFTETVLEEIKSRKIF